MNGVRCHQVSSNVTRRIGKNGNREKKKKKKKELDVGVKT